jgi:hypothetical protein
MKRYTETKKDSCEKCMVDISDYRRDEEGLFILRTNGRPLARIKYKDTASGSHEAISNDPEITITCLENEDIFKIKNGDLAEGNKKRYQFFVKRIRSAKFPKGFEYVKKEIRKHI